MDTGDRVDGNGLYDASHPKGIYTSDIFKEQDINVICSGNHELYKRNTSEREYFETAPNFHDNYLASNIDIYDPRSGEQVPLAQRYKKFTTKNQGIRIIAFGFLFDFQGNANNTVVQRVEQTVQEKWFQEAIRDREVDLFLVAGHVSLRAPEFDLIYKAIRSQQWDVPIQFFGGHTHIRDYVKYDAKAYGIESGRYMETIGFMSISGLATGGKRLEIGVKPEPVIAKAAPRFARRYIDNNLYSFHHHTLLNSTTFPTEHGHNVSSAIASARKALELDKRFGCAPKDLWMNRAPYPSEDSMITWIQDHVFPDMIHDPNHEVKPTLVVTNTGALRFDLFKGPFTVDTVYTVSPFTNGFRYIADVPYDVAKKIILVLNQEVPQPLQGRDNLRAPIPASVEENAIMTEDVATQRNPLSRNDQILLSSDEPDNIPLTPGYTTTDDAGKDGDDTIHSKITFYKVPNCVESRIGFPTSSNTASPVNAEEPEAVDLVYVDFIEQYILLALKFLGTDYSEEDTAVYMEGSTMTSVIQDWVKENWNGEC